MSTKTSISGKLASLGGEGLPTRKVYVFLPARLARLLISSAVSRSPAAALVPSRMPAPHDSSQSGRRGREGACLAASSFQLGFESAQLSGAALLPRWCPVGCLHAQLL